MNLHLRVVQWDATDSCRASFVMDGSPGEVETVFHLQRTPIGVSASPSSNIFEDCGGSAGEIRAIVAAIIYFCRTAQGELLDDQSPTAPASRPTDD